MFTIVTIFLVFPATFSSLVDFSFSICIWQCFRYMFDHTYRLKFLEFGTWSILCFFCFKSLAVVFSYVGRLAILGFQWWAHLRPIPWPRWPLIKIIRGTLTRAARPESFQRRIHLGPNGRPFFEVKNSEDFGVIVFPGPFVHVLGLHVFWGRAPNGIGRQLHNVLSLDAMFF